MREESLSGRDAAGGGAMPMASHTLLGKQIPTALSNIEMVLFRMNEQHRAETN